MVRYEYNLDVVPGNVPVMVPLKQYEDAYELIFHLYARTGTFTIPAGTTASIRGTKPDKNGISIDATLSGYDVTVSVIKQMTVVAGKGAYELVLADSNGNEFITATFYLAVQRAAMDESTLPSESQIKELASAINRADQIIEAADRVDVAYEYTKNIEERLENSVADAINQANNALNEAASVANDVEQLKQKQSELEQQVSSKLDDAYVENNALYMTANGEIKVGPLAGFGGGGGGGGSGGNEATMKVTNTSGFLSKVITDEDECVLSFTWSSIEDEMPTGDGTLSIIVAGLIVAARNVAQGPVSIDVAEYLKVGANVISLKIADVYGNSRTVNFSIQVMQLRINSSFDASVAYTGAIPFQYTPTGALQKTIHFFIDGEEVNTVVTSVSGRQMTWSIPMQSHGSHSFEVYFECTVNGQIVESNHLYYDLLCVVPGNKTKIVTVNCDTTEASQYSTLYIPWSCYDPGALTCEVEISVNGTIVSTQSVDRLQQIYALRLDEAIEYAVRFSAGTVSKTVTVTATPSAIVLSPTTEDLVLHLSASGRSNNEEDPAQWTFGEIAATFVNFNWVSDGWLSDDNGIDVLRIAGDAKLVIPYEVFASDCRTLGKTIELEFAVRNVTDMSTVVLSCISGGVGFKVSTQLAELNSTLSHIESPFKEDEHVRISFVVQKRTANRMVQIYINGILSGVTQYPATGDTFAQSTPVSITIGSSECVTDVYTIRVYDNNLSAEQLLDNWIADTQDSQDLVDRYYRNKIYDDYGQIQTANLPAALPYLILNSTTLPQSKKDPKVVSGQFVNPSNPAKSFSFTDAIFDVQGTSSQFYYRKNYTGEFEGFTLSSGATTKTYAMNAEAVPTSVFCFKADVASSEGANNVELVRLYCDTCPTNLAELLEKENVRQGIDGFPIVVFWNDGEKTTFLGKYNFNNDKSTAEVFGFESGDESWEIKNNTDLHGLWKDDNFEDGSWANAFEARYPEDYTNGERLAALAKWICSTDTEAATNVVLAEPVVYNGVSYTNDTAEYRLAKFKSELANHFDVDAILFNYLFTELFLMVDNRAKNAFPTYYNKLGKWFILPYDYDTALGINNEGALVFGYSLEDTDLTDNGAYVYNGQTSVLYVNIRKCCQDELKTMYNKLRADGKWSYNVVEGRFEAHQAVWSEAIFNEDAQVKYVDPLEIDGDASYLGMCQGSKAEQRKWWLFNRFRYMDSKYVCGDAVDSENVITLRCYATGSGIDVTPFVDMYAAINWANTIIDKMRVLNGKTVTFDNPLTTLNDTEVYLYNAQGLAKVEGLSTMEIGYANFSKATRLQVLDIGSTAPGYSNDKMVELHLGNNVLLKEVNAANCPSLGTGTQKVIDLSGCTGIKRANFAGTSISGVTLSKGTGIEMLWLPETTTSLIVNNASKLVLNVGSDGTSETFAIPSSWGLATLNVDNTFAQTELCTIINAMERYVDATDNFKPRVRIVNANLSFANQTQADAFFAQLDKFAGVDEHDNDLEKAQLSGTIFVPEITGAKLAQWLDKYPYVKFAYTTLASNLFYYVGGSLWYTEVVKNGADGIYTGHPTKSATAQYTYTFAGWSTDPNATSVEADARKAVVADRKVYAVFSAAVCKYTVKFVNASGALLSTVSDVPYGSTATGPTSVTYDGSEGTSNDFKFNGTWKPSNANITGDTTCVAQFADLRSKVRQLLQGTLTELSSDVTALTYGPSVDGSGNCCALFKGVYNTLEKVSLPKLKEVPSCCFISCSALTTVDISSATTIGSFAFYECRALSSIAMPSTNVTLGSQAFSYVTLDSLSFDDTSRAANTCFTQGYSFNYANIGRFDYTLYAPQKTAWPYNHGTVDPEDYRQIVDIFGYATMGTLRLRFEGIENIYSYNNSSTYDTRGPNLNSVLHGSPRIGNLVLDYDGTSGIVCQISSYTALLSASTKIYVPDALVSAYKEATLWCNVADQIYGLSTWAEEQWTDVLAAISDGTYKEKYSIGDTLPLYVGSEGYGDGYVDVQIVAFDTDTLADGSGKAPITWISKELLKTSQRMNPPLVTLSDGTCQEGTGPIGGWEKTELRAYMNGTIKPLIPVPVLSAIKAVKKTHTAYNTAGSSFTQTTTDEVWLPDYNEMFSSSRPYKALFPDNASRVKKKVGATSASWWWLRSASSTYNFYIVYSSGNYNYYGANGSGGVVLGFCT